MVKYFISWFQDESFEVPEMPLLGLFTRAGFQPMIFSCGNCPQREKIERIIEAGGGILQNPKYTDTTGHRINLIDKKNNRVNKHLFWG